MSYLSKVRCTDCGSVQKRESYETKCASCGGSLHIEYDIENAKESITRKALQHRAPSIWKYHEILPVINYNEAVSLGEGGTFLHKCDALAEKIGLDELYLKDETNNPTGSFIDRGTAVEVTLAKGRKLESVCCSSSGNLAVSLVAYAARARLMSQVFIDQGARVDSGKLYQILAYAAQVDIVRNQEEAQLMALEQRDRSHLVMSNNPHFLEGVKTTMIESCEQLRWTAPDWVLTPMGNGGHLSMNLKGLNEMKQLGLLTETPTRLCGVQAKGCSPIVDAFEESRDRIIPSKRGSTVAYDIGVTNPSSGSAALNAIRTTGGVAVAVSDNEILEAVKDLARLEGVFAEPAAATTIAGLKVLVRRNQIDRNERIVCMITGMGLKYPEIARSFVKGKGALEQYLSHVEGRRFTTKVGDTKLRILQILSKGESYGYAIWRALVDDAGIRITIPSVYQHISELKNSGLILRTRSEDTFQKRTRHLYALTQKGNLILDHLEKIR